MLNVVTWILVLFVVNVIHESGHYLAARFMGMSVAKMNIGLGPSLIRFTWARTLVSINVLPMAASTDLAFHDGDTRVRTRIRFMTHRSLVFASGPLINLVIGLGLLATARAWGFTGSLNLNLFPVLPRAAASFTASAGHLGWMVWQLGLISVYLGIFNMIPFGVLDGSHIVLAVLEDLAGKPVSEKTKAVVNTIVLTVALSTVIVISAPDLWAWLRHHPPFGR